MLSGVHAAMISGCYPCYPAVILVIRLLSLLSRCYPCYPAVILVIRLLSLLSDCYPVLSGCYPTVIPLLDRPAAAPHRPAAALLVGRLRKMEQSAAAP